MVNPSFSLPTDAQGWFIVGIASLVGFVSGGIMIILLNRMIGSV